jgi:hypothetical protein
MRPTVGARVAFEAVLVTRELEESLAAKVFGFVAIYSAIGVRNESANAQLGKAMMGGPQKAVAVTRVRRDTSGPTCWLHGAGVCLSM